MKISVEQLKSYISVIYSLEGDIWKQQQLYAQLAALAQKEPYLPVEPQKPVLKNGRNTDGKSIAVVVFIVLAIWAFTSGHPVLAILFFGIPLIFLIVAINEDNKFNEDVHQQNENSRKQYKEQFLQYEEDMRRYYKILNTGILAKAQMPRLKTQISDSKDVLNLIYSVGIVAEKYRSFIPVSSFHEYLQNGRCFSLMEIPGSPQPGAYNIYEMEARLDKIITNQEKLINLTGKLVYEVSALRGSQYMLAESIEYADRSSSSMIKRLEEALPESGKKLTNVGTLKSFAEYEARQRQRNKIYLNKINACL